MRTHGAIGGDLVDSLAVVERFRTLEDVIAWSTEIVEIVVQDEYTHDVVVRGPRPAFVVFDTT
ncbi:MAG: hypothetical protein WKG01_02245 [Kofleriaceae bacterium]